MIDLILHLICIDYKDRKCQEFLREHLHCNDSRQTDVAKWCYIGTILQSNELVVLQYFLKFMSQVKLLWSVLKKNVFHRRKCLNWLVNVIIARSSFVVVQCFLWAVLVIYLQILQFVIYHFEFNLIYYLMQLYQEQKHLVNLSKPPRCIFWCFRNNLMMFRPFTFWFLGCFHQFA